jgi:hypothetical protein
VFMSFLSTILQTIMDIIVWGQPKVSPKFIP